MTLHEESKYLLYRCFKECFLDLQNLSGWYLFLGSCSANLFLGMSLLIRYKPESCPAVPCSVLPDKVCSFGGTYDWFLPGVTGTNDITDSGISLSVCTYSLPLFFCYTPSLCFLSVSFFTYRPLSRPVCRAALCSCHSKGLCNFWGVSCLAAGRKLLASFQPAHTKTTVLMASIRAKCQWKKLPQVII